MLQAVSIKNYLSFKEQKRLLVREGKLVVVGEGKQKSFKNRLKNIVAINILLYLKDSIARK